MSKFYQYINEATSSIKSQLEELENDETEWANTIKAWIFGKDSPFVTHGQGRFRSSTSKQIPKDVKLKYPDIIFALQTLSLHVGGEYYFNKWQEVKKYLTFKKKYNERTFFRFWNISKDQLQNLKDGESIPLGDKGRYASYTYNEKLFKKIKGSTQLVVAPEFLQKSLGQELTLLTKHRFVPIFDIFHFYVHLIRQVKKIFDAKESDLKGFRTLDTYSMEREVIGPAVSSIDPKDVVGYYEKGAFSNLEDESYNIVISDKGHEFEFQQGHINNIKNKYKERGKIDITMFQNKVVVTTDSDSTLLDYTKGNWIKNDKLSQLVGTTIYTGYWR